MDRRDFLKGSFLTSMALSLPGFALADGLLPLQTAYDHKTLLALLEKSKNKYSYLTMTGVDPTVHFVYERNGDLGAKRPGVVFFNDDQEQALIEVPIFAHSIEQNPNHPNRIMLIPKRISKCVEFDIVENKVISEITLDKKKFYGHGCYIPGTDLFYASTYLYDSKDASMVIFDHKKNKIVKEIDIPGGAGAHQCTLSLDKKYIIITFSEPTPGHRPSLVWFDISSGEVVDRVYGLDTHSEHFLELNDGNIVYTGGRVTNEVKLPPVVFGCVTKDKKVNNYSVANMPKYTDFVGQGIAIVALEHKKQFVVTNLTTSLIYFYNYETGALIKTLPIRKPRGISLSNDGKKMYVTSLSYMPVKVGAEVTVIDVETSNIIGSFMIKNSLAMSSHISKYLMNS